MTTYEQLKQQLHHASVRGDEKQYIGLSRQLPFYYPESFQKRVKAYDEKHRNGDPTRPVPYLQEYMKRVDDLERAIKIADEALIEETGFRHFCLLPEDVRDAVLYTRKEGIEAGYPPKDTYSEYPSEGWR